jgi:hypothetical protein
MIAAQAELRQIIRESFGACESTTWPWEDRGLLFPACSEGSGRLPEAKAGCIIVFTAFIAWCLWTDHDVETDRHGSRMFMSDSSMAPLCCSTGEIQ